MTRLEKICAELAPCEVLADVGCDHGLVAKYALENNICKSAVITDISQKCLEKAQKLLESYSKDGRLKSYCTDGLSGVVQYCDQAVIGGMGGREIILVIESAPYLPKRLVLQPMKNAFELREALQKNYRFIKDYMFISQKKRYDLMVLETGGDNLNRTELVFGRTNMQNPSKEFLSFLEKEKKNITERMKRAGVFSKKELEQSLNDLLEAQEVLNIR